MYWENFGPVGGDAACCSGVGVSLKKSSSSSEVTEAWPPAKRSFGAESSSAAERFLTPEALLREPHSLRSLAPLLQARGRRVLARRVLTTPLSLRCLG